MKRRAPLELVNRDGDGGDEPTAAERAWWREASRPERRRYFLRMVPWMAGSIIIPAAIRNPRDFAGGRWLFLVPLGVFGGFITGLACWHFVSPSVFQLRLGAKRIRDALLEER